MNPQLRRLQRSLTADKKKLAAMLILLFAGMLLWGRLMLKQVPRSALAHPAAAKALAGASSDKRSASHGDRPRQAVKIDLTRTLHRDLFRLDRTHYGWVDAAPSESAGEEKSDTQDADELRRKQAVFEAAQGLKLQTTIHANPPRAMINGQLIGVGQRFRGFLLKEVQPRHVLVEMNGIVVKLEM